MTDAPRKEIGVICPYCHCLTIKHDEYEFNKKKVWSQFNNYHYLDVICINPECESENRPIRLCLGYFAKKYYPSRGQNND